VRSLLVFVPILALYVLLFRRFDFVCDDAYITYQYAKQLAAGNGLRFHAAAEPIQGYSNFLWVLINALFIRLGIDPGFGSRVVSFACGLHLLLSVMRLAAERAGGRLAAPLAAGFLLAALAPFAAWSSSGLETMAVAWALFRTFECLVAAERPRPVAAAVAAIAAGLSRTDAIVYLGGVVIGAWFATAAERRRAFAKAVAPAASVVLATLACYPVWCLAYFGDGVPQTVHAKVTGSSLALEQGMQYLVTLAITFPSLWLALLVPRGTPAGAASLVNAATGITLWGYAYAGLAGGDWMAFGRFLVPVLPFLALSFGLRAPSVVPGASGFGIRGGIVAAVILLSVPGAFDRPRVPESILRRLHFRWNTRQISSELEFWRRVEENARENVMLGRALALHTRPGDSIVLGAIGAVAWTTDLFIYDRNGLVSKEVTQRDDPAVRRSPGHLRNVPPTFFLEAKPTILDAAVVHSSVGVSAIPAPGHAVAARYERVALPLRTEDGFPEGSVLVLLRRRDAGDAVSGP
jgi:hypothetical protein